MTPRASPWASGGWLPPWISAILLAYAAGFVAFYPDVLTTSDEAIYVEQAAAFADGRVGARDAAGIVSSGPISGYPPGASMLQAPFVWAGGWRAAAWTSVLSMTITVVILARWLADAGYAPGFALLFLAYAPTLVMGRIASSDMPSAATVALAMWLFWCRSGSRRTSFAAGLVMGLSLLVRETNLLIFLPFLAGAVARRDRHWHALGTGVLAGVGVRLAVSQAIFGSAVFLRDGDGWSLAAGIANLPFYTLALFVLAPGALVAVALYDGRYRKELIAAVALFVGVHLLYNYSGESSEGVARIAAAGRYLIPLMPLIAIAWAAAVSRHMGTGVPGRFVAIAASGVLVAAVAVHPFVHAWSRREAAVMRDIYAKTAGRGAVIADDRQRKYVSPVYDRRAVIWMADSPASQLAAMASTYQPLYIVVVSRSETSLMADLTRSARDYLDEAQRYCEVNVVHDEHYGAERHLQIVRILACRPYRMATS